MKRACGASQNRRWREARRSQYVDIGKASDKVSGDYGRTPLGLAQFWPSLARCVPESEELQCHSPKAKIVTARVSFIVVEVP
jgi:hypothetical protein